MDEDRRRERARQYAVCTYALRHDRASDGAEAIYDQALTNGLAAIVAHSWPGEEMERSGGRTRAAIGLLRVIEERSAAAGECIVHVRHSEDAPDYEDHPAFGRIENFTRVNVAVFRGALDVTQEVRHARATGEQGVTLADEHIKALVDLEYHPVLFAINDELVERAQAGIAGRDATERARAWAYYEALDAEERERRQAIDYADQHAWETSDDRSAVDDCPVCETRALVAPVIEGVIGEIGIGFCFVCSYQRTIEYAEEFAYQLDMDRAIERAMEHND